MFHCSHCFVCDLISYVTWRYDLKYISFFFVFYVILVPTFLPWHLGMNTANILGKVVEKVSLCRDNDTIFNFKTRWFLADWR